MGRASRFIEWLMQLPNWAKTTSGIITAILAIVGLFRVYQENYYAFILIVVPILVLAVIVLGLYLIFATTPSSIIEGRHLPKYHRYLRLGAGCLIFLELIAGVRYYTSASGRETITSALYGTPTSTPTPTHTATPTATSTFTSTPSPMPTSPSNVIYYMIVMDASEKMNEGFDGSTKWEAASEAVTAILEGSKPGAHYGLIVIGGEPAAGLDPCAQPAEVRTSFSSRQTVREELSRLNPAGGGSLYQAFVLAQNQFEGLPENSVRTLIYITDSSDACESRDEWRELERLFQLPGGLDVNLYSEIIIIDQNGELDSQSIPERISALSENVNVVASQSLAVFQQSYSTVINNVNIYINNEIETLATQASNPAPPIVLPTNTIALQNPPPVAIPTTQAPPTPVPPTPVPPTITPAPSVQLLSATYVGAGEGCSANVTFQVSGGPVTGQFRVTNKWYATQSPPYDPNYPIVTLLTGINSYTVGLGGNGNPEYYSHQVWFFYNGAASNVLAGLVCPGLTPVP